MVKARTAPRVVRLWIGPRSSSALVDCRGASSSSAAERSLVSCRWLRRLFARAGVPVPDRAALVLDRWRMSLFGAVQMAGNTLQAMQIGLQVVGNNISNANTPGYIRQQANFTPTGVQKQGDLILGLGVRVDSITEQVDKFV